jgi:hypothetical protein
MAHSDSVADGNCIKFERHGTCFFYGLFYDLGDFVEVDVARDDFAEAVSDADKGFFDVLISQAAGAEQASVGRLLEAFFYGITSHNLFSPKMA